ncbi:hypothetical protein ACIG56_10430 [Nocardia fusca]|uniref:hypothetical protein n=1 Tax=Nocardia fusca TaxID=941183 RepID=UPI0037C716D0
MPREHLPAVLVATVFTLRARAADDVLELFDQVMVNDLMSKAERQSRDEKLRRYPRVTRNANKLAKAVKALLEMAEVNPWLSMSLVWDLVENTVTRAELRAAVAAIDELVPASDTDLDGQRLEELAGRLNTVRMFLPALMRTVDFGATGEAKPVLAAMIGLADLLTNSGRAGHRRAGSTHAASTTTWSPVVGSASSTRRAARRRRWTGQGGRRRETARGHADRGPGPAEPDRPADPRGGHAAARLSPFVREHIGLVGHYAFHLPDFGGGHRLLRDLDAADD